MYEDEAMGRRKRSALAGLSKQELSTLRVGFSGQLLQGVYAYLADSITVTSRLDHSIGTVIKGQCTKGSNCARLIPHSRSTVELVVLGFFRIGPGSRHPEMNRPVTRLTAIWRSDAEQQ